VDLFSILCMVVCRSFGVSSYCCLRFGNVSRPLMASKSHGRIWKRDLGLFILGFFYLGYTLLVVSGSYFWVCEFCGL
jgi:hypothetical protein